MIVIADTSPLNYLIRLGQADLSEKATRCVIEPDSSPSSETSSLIRPLEALAASTVKVAARDVIASWKVLITLGIAPFLYGFYAFLATLTPIKAGAPLK